MCEIKFLRRLEVCVETEIAVTVDWWQSERIHYIDGARVELDALVQDFMASDAGVPFRLPPPEIGPAEFALRGLLS